LGVEERKKEMENKKKKKGKKIEKALGKSE